MFGNLFDSTGVLHRHEQGAFSKERNTYLKAREKDGYSRFTLAYIARFLLWSGEKLQAEIHAKKKIRRQRVEEIGCQWFRQSRCRNRKRNRRRHLNLFVQEVSGWLRSLKVLEEPKETRKPYSKFLDEFKVYMESERGFSFDTVLNRRKNTGHFLEWCSSRKRSLHELTIADVDRYLKHRSENGYCRRSLAMLTAELRVFFRFAEKRAWCRQPIASAIESPRVYREEKIPAGLPWKDVKRLFSVARTNELRDIRDLPILMLFAIYGLRAIEVSQLCLDDIDWSRKELRIVHAKNRRTQTFPLLPSVGNVILRYLRVGRPKSGYREVFLKLTPPLRPISRGSLNHVVKSRMIEIDAHCLHRGPHSLRHACATRLLAEGLSLKEVGDHLGHQSTASTKVYAKVNLNQLRLVGDFNFGDFL